MLNRPVRPFAATPMPLQDHARLTRLKARRKVWLEVHLWLGLIAGMTLTVFGITGAILVFQQEIDELLNPGLLTVDPESGGESAFHLLDEILAAGTHVMPAGAKLTFVRYPRNDNAAFRLEYQFSVPSRNRSESWETAVNPYTATVTGMRLLKTSESIFPKTFVWVIFELHYAFFLGDELGYLLTGIFGSVLMISTLTGLILWWPLTGNWLAALTIKSGASAERLNYDIHKSAGFYTLVVMLPVLFSGIYMNLPQYVAPLIELFSPVSYRYWFHSTPSPETVAIGLPRAVKIANTKFPTGRMDWLYVPTDASGTYTVCKQGVEDPGSWITRRCVVMDQFSGRILDVDDPAHGTAGEVFTHWQWPLHSGHAFGWTGRILVFITGLAGPVLFVTGVIRWLQKRSAKRQRQCRTAVAEEKTCG